MVRWFVILMLGFTACSGGKKEEAASQPSFGRRMADDVIEAAQSPFEDIGLKREEIPLKLQAIADKPYTLAGTATCESLAREIAELDALLGADADVPVTPDSAWQDKYVDEGSDMAIGAASGFTMNKVGIIPFRGVVRRVSGAEKHARTVTKAYQAGKLRRSYLKGIAYARRCDLKAA